MPDRHNAPLVGLAVVCALFLSLDLAARLQVPIALALSVLGGGIAMIAAYRWPQTTVRSQSFHINHPLPSSNADFNFELSAEVVWQATATGVTRGEDIARQAILRRASDYTRSHHPSQASVIVPGLSEVLGSLEADSSMRIEARAESVNLALSERDSKWLDELAAHRREERLWEQQRRHEKSTREYFHNDVLKNTGSAVVWWLARNQDKPESVAQSINILAQLTHAANNADEFAFRPAGPPGPVEQFEAFLDSLDPSPDESVRLLLTHQVANAVGGHDARAAEDMRRRYAPPDEADSAKSHEE
jgi:hypothetical protein